MIEQQSLFMAGEKNYHTYRIPSLLVTQKGTVLAFCEARKEDPTDAGEIDIAVKRSADSGKTWSELEIAVEDGTNTAGNPCAVQDRDTGTIWLLFCQNEEQDVEKDILQGKGSRRIFVISSEDDGITWSKPEEITRSVKKDNWTWYAIGPCHAIQLKSGRLIAACNHAVLDPEKGESGPYTAHVIYSDNHGKDWTIGGIIGEFTNESTLAELEDGTLYINMRSYHNKNQRASAWSKDGGDTWSEIQLNEDLIDPVCQGSVLALPDGELLFSNPASINRENMTIKTSKDGGKSWMKEAVIYAGPSGYSDLAVTKDHHILCLYESGKKEYFEEITLARYKRVAAI